MNLRNPFRTLKYRNFRLLWTGEVLRTSAQWMDTITRGFLVWELTGSETQLALVTAVRAAPLFVVGLIAGVLADRIDRKRLLMSSQSLNIIANLAVAVLIMTGTIELWHIYLTVLIVGFSMSINQPARQSLIPSLVPADDLQAAVVLNTATLNIGQAIGPVIGGIVVGSYGLAPAFVVQAVMIAGAGMLISRIKTGRGCITSCTTGCSARCS
jgi:MFS family permease